MYGLKQAAVLAFDHLVDNIKDFGYEPIPHTIGMWKHKARKTTFCLCVDDFGVKHFSKDDAVHLVQALSANYKLSLDWSGTNFFGLHIDWDYDQGYVDISMPHYVRKVLARCQHDTPPHPVHTPFKVAPYRSFIPRQR